MIRYRRSANGLCLILAMICTLIPKPARADDGSQERPIRLYANAAFGPIGTLYSLSAVTINGRPACGEQMIWGGEMLEVSANSSAYVFLESVGQITLRNAAMAKLATAFSGFGDNDTHRVLVASLISGEMTVKLQHDAEAYIEACESVFTSSSGANFQLGVRKGQVVVDSASGAVWAEAVIPQPGQIEISRVGFDRNTGSPFDLGNAPLKQNRNTPGQFNVQLKRRKRPGTIRRISFTSGVEMTEGQVAQDEEPVADTSVLFELTPPDIGIISPQKVRTNGQGIATTTFAAGPGARRGKLKVTAEETGDSREWDVIVLGFWTTRSKILIGSAAAAATVLIIKPPGGGGGKLQQVPPPTIP